MISKGNQSVEVQEFKHYTGVASTYVKGVNPNAKELGEFFGREIEKEPEYSGTLEVDGENVPYIRLDFLLSAVQKDAKTNEEEELFKTRATFFLRKKFKFKKDKSKVQVIDNYGYTAWATKEELDAQATLFSDKGNPYKIASSYRPAFVGEEELTNFIKCYLNYGEALAWIDNNWVMNPKVNPDDCQISLDLENYFKGDISELKEICKYFPNNKLKVLYGVRTNPENGRQYQAIYNRMFLKNGAFNFNKLAENVENDKNYGAFPTTDFEVGPIKVYDPTPTTFPTENVSSKPVKSPWD